MINTALLGKIISALTPPHDPIKTVLAVAQLTAQAMGVKATVLNPHPNVHALVILDQAPAYLLSSGSIGVPETRVLQALHYAKRPLSPRGIVRSCRMRFGQDSPTTHAAIRKLARLRKITEAGKYFKLGD